MKKILHNNDKTKKYLNSLPKIYIVAQWAHWGIREYPFSGKWKIDDDGTPIPLVWDYWDCNGACDDYHLSDIRCTTMGVIRDWSFNKCSAEKFAELLESEEIAKFHRLDRETSVIEEDTKEKEDVVNNAEKPIKPKKEKQCNFTTPKRNPIKDMYIDSEQVVVENSEAISKKLKKMSRNTKRYVHLYQIGPHRFSIDGICTEAECCSPLLDGELFLDAHTIAKQYALDILNRDYYIVTDGKLVRYKKENKVK